MGALRTGRRRAFAAAAALGLSGTAYAQEPGRLPVLGPGTEVYYGTTKVAPLPAPPIPVVEMTRTPVPVAEPPRPRVEAPIYVPVVFLAGMWSRPTPASAMTPSGVMPARYEFTLPRMQSPVMALLAAVMKRLMPVVAPHPTTVYTSAASSAPTLVIIRESASEPRPQPITLPQAPPAQVVVVHEPAPVPVEPKPAPPEPGYRLSPEMMVSAGVGMVCLLGVAVALARSGRSMAVMAPPAPAVPSGPPANHDPAKDGPLLMGQYRAGQLPDTAERFEIGPSYQDEVRAKQQQEEASKQAVVAHILSQNLGLLDATADEPTDDDFTVDIRN